MAEGFKVVLVGDVDVGKTSLFNRFKTGKFLEGQSEGPQARRDAEHHKTWEYKGEQLSITLYDTAGMERFEGTVPPTYFRNAFAVIFVYAINSQESINNMASWADSISYQRIGDTSKTIVKALVGNKADLKNDREVSATRRNATAEQAEIKEHLVFEVSALTGDGVDKMFSTIAKELKGIHKEPESKGSLPPPNPKPRPCCGGGSRE